MAHEPANLPPMCSKYGWTMPVKNRTGWLYEIEPWGYIEEIAIRFQPFVANMDASNPHRFIFEPLTMPENHAIGPHSNQNGGIQVFARVRNID